MSLISAKYFNNCGWVLLKNSDSVLKPSVKIRKSFIKQTERLYIWNNLTKFSEGVNEHGVAIVSAISNDDVINAKSVLNVPEDAEVRVRKYYSPDGLRIRKSLYEKTARHATKKLLENQIPGSIIIADERECFVIQAGFSDKNYFYEVKQLETSASIVLGEEDDLTERSDIAMKAIRFARNQQEFLEAMSLKSEDAPCKHPLILTNSKNSKRTSGQIMICPSERTLHYRPIWSESAFDLNSLNKGTEKTFFEVISKRKLISFKEGFQNTGEDNV